MAVIDINFFALSANMYTFYYSTLFDFYEFSPTAPVRHGPVWTQSTTKMSPLSSVIITTKRPFLINMARLSSFLN